MPEDGGLHLHSQLSDAERERLYPGIDVDALERLLAAIPPGTRDVVLDAFDANPRFRAFEASLRSMSLVGGLDGRPVIPAPLELVFKDPALQRLIEPVSASLRSARAEEVRRRQAPEWYQRVERPAREAPILLVMPAEWKDDAAAAMVVRRTEGTTEGTPHDMILLDAARVNAAVLDIALEALVAERRYFGVIPRRSHTIAIGPARVLALPAAQEARLTGTLGQLREESERTIEGVGLARAVEFCIAH